MTRKEYMLLIAILENHKTMTENTIAEFSNADTIIEKEEIKLIDSIIAKLSAVYKGVE